MAPEKGPYFKGRQLYSQAQLTSYFDRIVLPASQRVYSVTGLSDADKLSYATLLQKHQLVKVPFENLTQHYSWHKTVDVRPQHLFNKVVLSAQGEGRGGYCMEANTFFHTVLLSLGFQAYQVGARVCHGGRYGGLSHTATILMLSSHEKYLIDVAFGGNCPVRPIPLKPGSEEAHIASAKVRLLHEPIEQFVNQECKIWVYQVKIHEGAEWMPVYCFMDAEFLPEDIRGMNLSPWKAPNSFLTWSILMTRYTTDREVLEEDAGPGLPDEQMVSQGEIDGVVILNHDEVKWRRCGKTVVEFKLHTEKGRLEALRKYFGIVLDEEDESAIRGMASELKGKRPD
jgi:arylamine N-acetyltransferase